MDTACKISELFSAGACFDFWLNRYQTLIVGIVALGLTVLQVILVWQQLRLAQDQFRLGRQQANILSNQEAIVAKQIEISEAQARSEIRSNFSQIMRFTDPGIGKHFHRDQAPIHDLSLSLPRDQALSLVAVAYPNGVDAVTTLLDAVDGYQAAIKALPPEKLSAPDGQALWLPGRGLGAAFEYDEAATRYFDAISKLYSAANPVRHIFDAS